jgi:hypothetical protein
MRITQTGTFRDNASEKTISIKPLDSVRNILFDWLDYFLGFLEQENPGIPIDFSARLTKKFQDLAAEESWMDMPEQIQEISTEFSQAAKFPRLNCAAVNYFFDLLGISEASACEPGEVEVTMRALVQAWVFPPYFALAALAETIGRAEAGNFYKRYITNYYMDHPSPNRDDFTGLEQMVEKRLSGDTTSSEWVIVHSLLADGKYAFKNKNCPTCVDAMADIPDVEFKYLVCCYGDYAKFRSQYGDHIILTMEHTLMEGDPYCSRILHDTRVDFDLRHPPKEFWDNFESESEEAAEKIYLRWKSSGQGEDSSSST